MRAQVLPRLAAMGCAVVLATASVAPAAAVAAVAPNSSQPVQVFPVAGSQTISPESQISFGASRPHRRSGWWGR